MAIISKKEMKKSKNRKTSQKKKRKPNKKLIGGSNQPEEYVEFFTKCNNEFIEKKRKFVYDIRNIKLSDRNLVCTPLINKLEMDVGVFLSQIRKIFNTRNERNKEIYVAAGGYKEFWKVNDKIVLGITNLKEASPPLQERISDELTGFYLQSLFSKPIKDGGYGIQGIPMVYDFGKYEYQGRIHCDKEGVYGFQQKGGEELFNSIEHLPLKPVVSYKIIFELLIILLKIHKRGYIHRDIKTENILVTNLGKDNQKIDLIDFGFVVKEDKNNDYNFRGTPGFLYPEWFQNKNHPYENMDLWAVGIMLVEFILHKGNILEDADNTEIWQIPTESFFTDFFTGKTYERNQTKKGHLINFLECCFVGARVKEGLIKAKCKLKKKDGKRENRGEQTYHALRYLYLYMKDDDRYTYFLTTKLPEYGMKEQDIEGSFVPFVE